MDGWYDAGKIDTLLATNRVMLEKRGMARRPRELSPDARIIDPVYVEDGAIIRRSTVGPNVSVGAGTVIEDSTIRDAIVGKESRLARVLLQDSLIGDRVVLEGYNGTVTIGDDSELRGRI